MRRRVIHLDLYLPTLSFARMLVAITGQPNSSIDHLSCMAPAPLAVVFTETAFGMLRVFGVGIRLCIKTCSLDDSLTACNVFGNWARTSCGLISLKFRGLKALSAVGWFFDVLVEVLSRALTRECVQQR